MESRTPAEATDFSLLQISDSVALLTYTLVNKIQDSNSTYSVRSSIWKLENDKWKLVFHQGTHTGLG